MVQGRRVAVLAAGMSGAIAARRLAEAGFSVTVYDKGGAIGGRMATRRGSDHGPVFDHGARFMRAHGADFARQLADWRARGVVADWPEAKADVGMPGMTAPVRDLLDGIETRSGRTVTAITRSDAGWNLAIAEDRDDTTYDAVAVSFPAPQVAEALKVAIARSLGAPFAPFFASAHRWRYAQVETALGQDCLYDPSLRLGACGDWCLGPRIEAAYDSGAALAARIISDLSERRALA